MVSAPLNKQYLDAEWTTAKVQEEVQEGLDILNSVSAPIVSVFGSHRASEDNPHYVHCKRTAAELGTKGFAILSGGGPGIMRAANLGATEAGAVSIGFKAHLLKGERVDEPIYTHLMEFHFLFVRRFIMHIKSKALIFYPGGYGTLNELFEYLTLMQTGIVDRVPVICVSEPYWKGLFSWIEKNPLKNSFLINEHDVDLVRFANETDDILDLLGQ